MSHSPHNLDDLVRASGFSKRQIRFYITRKLIPGAGDNRGPNAVYPDETLARLLRIAELKQRRLPPTGRRLTLEEIRHELDLVPAVPPQAEPGPRKAIDWDGQFSDHLMKSSQASVEIEIELDDASQTIRTDDEFSARSTSALFQNAGPHPLDNIIHEEQLPYGRQADLRQLLEQLSTVLDEMSGVIMQPAPGDGNWLHLSNDDLKIQVRWPESRDARSSVRGQARALRQLLNREVSA